MAMHDEDLLGDPYETHEEVDPDPPEVRKARRPQGSEHLDITDVYRGVTVTWLMNAFRMDRNTVKRKTAQLHPLRMAQGNVAVYDFVQAASVLVKPKVDLNEYIKTLRPEDMPNDLQKEFWDAKLKRQKYEAQAGELWHTTDVIDVFGDAFKHIKTSTQLWVSQLERTTGLTPEQYKVLEKLADQLLDDLHKQLTSMKKSKSTYNSNAKEAVGDV